MARKLLPSDEVWQRQPGESGKAYAAFEYYLEMGDERSIVKVAEKCRKNTSLMYRWSSLYNWKERAQEYDNFIVSGKAKKVRREIEARYERLARISDQLIALALTKVKAADPQKLTHREAIDYITLGLRLAEASRAVLTIPEVQARRLDLAYLKLEASQVNPPSEQGESNLIEALSATLTETVCSGSEIPDY